MDLKGLLERSAVHRTRELMVEDVMVRVREPTAAVHSRYGVLWSTGRDVEAMTHLLRHCVVDDAGLPCLNDKQAAQFAQAPSSMCLPVVQAILDLALPEKKPHAPAADAVPDQPAAGAAPV